MLYLIEGKNLLFYLSIDPSLDSCHPGHFRRSWVSMFAPDSPNAPNIAIITIVCGWVFSVLAILSVVLLLWSRRALGRQLDANDYLTFLLLRSR